MPKPSPSTRRPPNVERDGEAGVVHAVEQAPQAVAHADHAVPAPCRRLARRPRSAPARSRSCAPAPGRPAMRRLRAARQVRRRVVQRQHPRGHVAAAGQVDQPLVDADQLRHVARSIRRAVHVARAARRRPPAGTTAGSPATSASKNARQRGPGRGLGDRVEREGMARPRSTTTADSQHLEAERLGAAIHGRRRRDRDAPRTAPLIALDPRRARGRRARGRRPCSRPRVTRMPRSAPG